MSLTINKFFASPTKMFWWEYPKLAGMVGLIVVLGALLAGIDVPAWIVGLALHTILDFTLQSSWVAANKADRGLALTIHSIIAGGIPSAITGLIAGGPIGCLVGVIVGIVSHYAVDYTRKFNIKDWRVAIVVDQTLHLVVLLGVG